jgi:hypothetical protein
MRKTIRSIRALILLLSFHTASMLCCLAFAQDGLGVPDVYLGTWINLSGDIWTSITVARGQLRIAGVEEEDKSCRVEQAKTYQSGGILGFGGEPAVAVTCEVTPQFRRRISTIADIFGVQASPSVRRIIHLKQKDGGRLIDVSEEILGMPPERQLTMGEFGRR